MNPILLDLGFIKIYWYSILILIGVVIAGLIFIKEAKKQSVSTDFIVDLLFYGIIIGVIGARLYYVIFELDYYIKNPLEIIETWNGGLAIHGGIIAGAIWFIYYSKKKKYNPLKILDMASPAIIIAQAIGRWGNFFNSECHGMAVERALLEKQFIPEFIIDRMYINGVYYLPTFYYEFLWNVLGFIVILLVRKFKKNKKPGLLLGIYFMWYSFGRFFIESMRTDSLMLGPVRVAMLASVVLFVIGLILCLRKEKEKRK